MPNKGSSHGPWDAKLIPADHQLLKWGEYIFARQPLRFFKGLISAHVAYPIAEIHENRCIRPKFRELSKYYQRSWAERRLAAQNRLAETLIFAGQRVPYYRDLFSKLRFHPEKVFTDERYLEDLPYLNKSIIGEQGDRMLSRPLSEVRHYACKTGGSTGQSAVIYYDQPGVDYSAAVTLYARDRIGKKKSKTELHFACRFPDQVALSWPTREDFKCFAMNRSNIFFDRIDDVGLEEILQKLKRRRPYLVHEHPSTIYALACYVERKYGAMKIFEVFESSGELLQSYMREKIRHIFKCRVIDRYGLAELGVIAYELNGYGNGLQVLESEGWPESRLLDDGAREFVFTGFHNRLMPLIRYTTGDQAEVIESDNGFFLMGVVGRIHDVIPLNGINYPTHHIMDMLDHRVGGILEFQIDLRYGKPILRIVVKPNGDPEHIRSKIEEYWSGAFSIEFVALESLARVGSRSKFRHVVTQ